MKSVPIYFHLQESSVVCPKCGSAIHGPLDLCLVCMLSLGIDVDGMGVDGANDEALAELLDEMDGLAMLILAASRAAPKNSSCSVYAAAKIAGDTRPRGRFQRGVKF